MTGETDTGSRQLSYKHRRKCDILKKKGLMMRGGVSHLAWKDLFTFETLNPEASVRHIAQCRLLPRTAHREVQCIPKAEGFQHHHAALRGGQRFPVNFRDRTCDF